MSDAVAEFLAERQEEALARMGVHARAATTELRSAGSSTYQSHPYAVLAATAAAGFVAQRLLARSTRERTVATAPAGNGEAAAKPSRARALLRFARTVALNQLLPF